MKWIYKIENKINWKIYIWSSRDVEKRFKQHLLVLRNWKHWIILQNSFNKYWENNFKFEILEEINDDNLLLKIEQKYINNISINKLLNTSRVAEWWDKISYHPNRKQICEKISKSQIWRKLNNTENFKWSNNWMWKWWVCSNIITCKCNLCWKQFNKIENQIKNFCSLSCKTTYSWKKRYLKDINKRKIWIKKCLFCNNDFTFLWDINWISKRKYCNISCSNNMRWTNFNIKITPND